MRFFAAVFCLFFHLCYAEYQYQLTMTLLFRDEAPYLKEWIEFHRLQGVEHFYLRNHKSTDNYREVLRPYIEEGVVELTEEESGAEADEQFWAKIHRKFYLDSLERYRGVSKWVAFIDSDEFLFSTSDKETLLDILNSYEQYGGVVVNWQMFGTSGVKKIEPHQLLIEKLTSCAPVNEEENRHIKSILRPEFVIDFRDPHSATYVDYSFQVNTDGHGFIGAISPYVQVNRLRINHYWTRDEEFFYKVKIARRVSLGYPVVKIIEDNHRFNLEKNTLILRYAPALREAMGM